MTVLVLIAVAVLICWILYVAIRVQRQREVTGGKDPHESPPEPAPDRREPPSDQPSRR